MRRVQNRRRTDLWGFCSVAGHTQNRFEYIMHLLDLLVEKQKLWLYIEKAEESPR